MKRMFFSHWSYRRILRGRKTQTRRVIRPVREFLVGMLPDLITAPYQGGDICGVATPHQRFSGLPCIWDAVTQCLRDPDGHRQSADPSGSPNWRGSPAFFMPGWACLHHVRIEAVEAQWLHDITLRDILAEGSSFGPLAWRARWDSIYKKPGERHADNPAVYAYTFRLLPEALA